MLENLISLLQIPFAQNALIAIIPLSIMCGILGVLIIVNRLSYVAGGLAHGAYGGIGIGVYFGIPVLISAMGFLFVLALLMAYLIRHHKHASDNFIGAIWAFGMALGILLIQSSSGYQADMMGYLFGNILVLSGFNLALMFALALIFLGIIFLLYPQIQALSYDEDFAQTRGIKCERLFYLLALMIASCVIVSMQAVGLILVIALLSIPTFIAQGLSQTLKGMMLISTLLNIIFCFLGLMWSFLLDLPSGASIVMVSTLGFFIFLGKKIKGNKNV